MKKKICGTCQEVVTSRNLKGMELTLEETVKCFIDCLPKQISEILTTFDDSYSFPYLPHRPADHTKVLNEMKRELESTELYQVLKKILTNAGNESQSVLLSCVFILSMPLSLANCSFVVESLQQTQEKVFFQFFFRQDFQQFFPCT